MCKLQQILSMAQSPRAAESAAVHWSQQQQVIRRLHCCCRTQQVPVGSAWGRGRAPLPHTRNCSARGTADATSAFTDLLLPRRTTGKSADKCQLKTASSMAASYSDTLPFLDPRRLSASSPYNNTRRSWMCIHPNLSLRILV
jgi:hypothetical protein